MRLLLTGAGGMLAHDVVEAVQAAGHDLVALTHSELDITDPGAVSAAVSQAGADLDVVINCAAWTDVDLAERHTAQASAVNGDGAGNVARAASAAGAWTIQISTDYVFDGAKREPYVESDPAAPLSAYGHSKLAGEHAVRRGAPGGHTIVRSSWLFGTAGACFPATILRLAREREELDVVDDQVGTPTFTAHLAAAVLELCSTRPLGVLHVAGAGRCSWFEFAREIVAAAGERCDVRRTSTAQMPRPARRPANSVLGTERPGDAPTLPDWRVGLSGFLADMVPAR